MKKFLIGIILFSALFPPINALNINITRGEVVNLGTKEILTEFGMIIGTIKFKLGTYYWSPKEIWLVPDGTLPNQFKSNSTYLEIPKNLTFSSCKTSVYYNQTLGYAFKILSSQILENGTFCGLAYSGSYIILAKY